MIDALNATKNKKSADEYAFNLDPEIVESRTNRRDLDKLKKNQETRNEASKKREKAEQAANQKK